jgi:hypothetical protein
MLRGTQDYIRRLSVYHPAVYLWTYCRASKAEKTYGGQYDFLLPNPELHHLKTMVTISPSLAQLSCSAAL